MINTLRYGGVEELEKDGKKVTEKIPPRQALAQMGPFIQVTISHPPNICEILKQEGKEIPTISVNALIDTGASSCVISPRVAKELGLVHTDYKEVSSVHGKQQQPVYYGFLNFHWGSWKEASLISCPLTGFDCLIGRDVLEHWHFTYNGRDGSIVICD